jgi:hypothetical protein
VITISLWIVFEARLVRASLILIGRFIAKNDLIFVYFKQNTCFFDFVLHSSFQLFAGAF